MIDLTKHHLEKRIKGFNADMNLVEASILGASFRSSLSELLESKKKSKYSESLQQAIQNNAELASDTRILLSKLREPETLDSEVIPLQNVVLSDPNSITEIYDEETPETLQAEISAREGGAIESFSLSIVLNEKQLAAKDMAFTGKSFVLTGPAGTGKTTAQRAVAKELLLSDRLSTCQFKVYDPATDKRSYKTAPSIAFCAFTRRAAANLQKAIFKDPILASSLANNVMTIHSLLEYQPETYIDYSEGEAKEKFRFAPMRNAANPLTITHLIIEEASMLDAIILWRNLYNALPSGIQIIFIGDINQLPSVFGPSILNYALVQLPVIELTEVYRNQGIVLENAHNILAGRKLTEDKDFVVVRGNADKQQGQHKTALALGACFNMWLDQTGSDGLPEYDPNDCIILSPWNKQDLGTDNLNSWIAQHLGARRNAIVYEVIAGFTKVYLAVGDRVMVSKLDGVIEKIEPNLSYYGKVPQLAGQHLSRFGHVIMGKGSGIDIDELLPEGTNNSVNYETFSLEALEAEKGERKNQASHCVTVKFDNGNVETLRAAGDFGTQNFTLGYALTVHKAQGSEWRKVFIILHKDHAISLYRELFYTAVTRARTKVTVIAKDFVIDKAIGNQRIKGTTMEDKIAYFNAGTNMENMEEPIYASK